MNEQILEESGTSEDLRDTIITIASRISRIDRAEFEEDVLIREELGIDSLMAMEILAHCERQLFIEIPESEMYEVQTVADFIEVIRRIHIEARGGDKIA